MQSLLIKVLFKTLFVLTVTILLVRCGSDETARQAAREAALNKAGQPAATQPNDDTAPIRPPEVGKLPLRISSVKAVKGAETCLPVTADRFDAIVSMQYTMKWDPAVLKYKDVKNFGLPGMAGTSFGARAADQGILAYSWFDANVQGITKTDGFTLYEVCFDVIGNPGSSSAIEFADAPVIIEISNAASQFLGIEGVNGKVSVE